MSNNKFFKSGSGSNFGSWSQFYKKDTVDSGDGASSENIEEIEDQLNAHNTALADKVDKEDGKELSENNYTDAEKIKLSDLPSSSQLVTDLEGKVDKMLGKELSDNNFTEELKAKLEDLDVDKLIAGEENTGITIIDSGDIFTIDESGFYYATANALNTPKRKPGYFILEVLSSRDKQITFVSHDEQSTFMIQQIEGRWIEWFEDVYFSPDLKDKLETLPTADRIQYYLNNKVDKESGKGLSKNDYTDVDQAKLSGIEEAANKYIHPSLHSMSEVSGLSSALADKVDKETGKGLSENDFTEELRTKLEGIDVEKLLSGGEDTGITIVDSEDIFEIHESGFYYAMTNAINTPIGDAGYFILEVLSKLDKQITFVNHKKASGYIIQQIEGHWGEWSEYKYFTPELKEKLDNLPTAESLQSDLDGKVDKVSGKGLSENDFTNSDKDHLYDHDHDEIYERKYKQTILVEGEADKYYPVVFKDGFRDVINDLLIYRRYSEVGPETWNTPTHKAALTAHFRTNFGGWGGAKYDWKLEEYRWLYAHTLGYAQFTPYKRGFIVFLRGGGAKYHIQSNQSLDIQIGYSTDDIFYTNSNPAYIVYAPEPLTEPKLDEIEGRIVPRNAEIDVKLDEKVDKVSGKGLSENDFTDELKSKLDTRTITTDENQTITSRKKITGTGELIKFGDYQLNGQDGWMTLGNESSHVWRIKYVGSTDGVDGNEFRIESGVTGKYYQMDHNGNMEYFDGSTTHKIWNGSNDGAGSGLDADTIDGLESRDFVQNRGLSLSSSDASVIEGSLRQNNITSGSNTASSSNYPTSHGQTWTFQGESTNRTFSIHRAASGKNLFLKYWNADATASDWIKLLHPEDLEIALATKVDKVFGKELSSNDFTDSNKTKLDGIEHAANKYIHPATHSMNEVSGLEDALNSKRDKPTREDAIIPVGSSGWYTIATCSNGRAIARFGLKDVSSGRHQSCIFHATHLYGDGNTINVIANALRYYNPIERIRIKDKSSTDGAALQIYVNTDNMPSTLTVYLLDDNFQYHGWKLIGLTKDGDTPDGISEAEWGNYQVSTGEIDLLIGNGSTNTSGDVYSKNEKLATENAVDLQLNNKVDKVSGKALSTNDFTNANKTKLDGIPDQLAVTDTDNDFTVNQTFKGRIIAENDYPRVDLNDTDSGHNDWSVINAHGEFRLYDAQAADIRLKIDSSGDATFSEDVNAKSFKVGGGSSDEFLKADGSIDDTSYVSEVAGMGLSENNLTDELQERLEQSVTDSHDITILQPKDAKLSLIGGHQGAIKIALPQGYSATMMKLEIDIFDYVDNKSIKVFISGYNYSTNQVWKNTSVQILANKDHLNYPVRFGYDGGKCCIYIGSLNTVWSYPKVAVTKGIFGYANYSYEQWISGWRISIDNTEFQSITRTHTDNLLQNITDAEVAKLAGIEEDANNYVHPNTHAITEVSGLSTTLDGKVDKVSGKVLSENDFTDVDKSKLDALDPYKIISGNKISGIIAYNEDLYDIKKSGFYYATSIAQNRPEGKNGFVLVEAFDEDNIKMTYSIHAKSHMYVVQKINGTWSSWERHEILSLELKEKLENLPENTNLVSDLNNKVDKVTGKGLSTNDFSSALKSKLDGIATGANKYIHPSTHSMNEVSGLSSALSGKVNTVSGKGLSENDLTDQLLLDTQQNVNTANAMTTLVPKDARLQLRQSTNKGALKVKLPQGYTNTMIKMTIEVFNYKSNGSFKVEVSGYTYASLTKWLQTSAQILSNNENYDLPVRFGYEDGKCCVYIGDLETNWVYPQIHISKISAGYSAFEKNRWLTGWDLSIESGGFKDVTAEHLNNLVNKFTNAYQSKLDGIATGANNYVHPSTHSISEVSGLSTALSGKVTAVSGKGLSTNDFSNTLKSKLDGISTGANKYVHPSTHSMNEISGLSSALAGKEATFSKKTAFNKNFGTASGTVMQGNDSRVSNGHTAYTWGNHATANYVQKDPSGNLGIGTDKPTVKLEINQLGDYDGIKIGDHFQLRTSGSGSDSFVLEHTKTNGNLYIRSRSASGHTGRLALNDNGGNVGIGASSPQQKLHVKGGLSRFQTDHGYLDLGALNTSYYHISTDRPQFYFSTKMQINGDIKVYGKETYMRQSDGAIYENNSRVATKTYVDQSKQSVQNEIENVEQNIERDRVAQFNIDRDRDELQLISNAGRLIAGMPLEDLRREILR